MGRRVVVVAMMLLGSAGLGLSCRHGRVLAAPPSLGDGVRVELEEARLGRENVDVELMAYNDTDSLIEINRNQIAVVAPDGSEYYRVGGREIHKLAPHSRHPINMGVRVSREPFRGAKGFYLRFDGFYAGDLRVQLPPMAVGQPTGSPGSPNAQFVAALPATQGATSGEQPGVFRRMYNAARGGDSAAPAQPPRESMQQYRGPRRHLKAEGLKCAAMPLKTKDVAEQMEFIMDELLLTELQQSGFEAIGPDDINALLGFEKTKEAVGCDDMSCVADIGGALGVEYITAGNVASLDGSMVLTLKLIDVRNTKVLSRVNKVADGGDKGLPKMIAEAVQELVARSEL